MDSYLNSYAEIKRLCREIDNSDSDSYPISLEYAGRSGIFETVHTGSDREDFYVKSNGVYYQVMIGKHYRIVSISSQIGCLEQKTLIEKQDGYGGYCKP